MTDTHKHRISVVIPMHNEAENVEPLIEEVVQALSSNFDYEIVVVDDGSKDNTLDVLTKLQQKIRELRVIKHKTNYGQSASVVTGIHEAHGDLIATLDGDGQNNPADIPMLYKEYEKYHGKQAVLIAGHRQQRDDSWLKLFSSRIANRVRGSLLKDDCPDSGCGIKLFEKDIALRLPHFNHMHRFLPALYKRAGGKVVNVPVSHRPRVRGQSKYGVMNRLWVGIVDLFGVAWLIRRPCRAELEVEERV